MAERRLQREPPRAHFLGAIVLDQLRRAAGHVETRLVIDGQQRLTTIQLFLQAFADLGATPKTERYHKALLKLVRNDDPVSEDDDEEFKVWPTNVDQVSPMKPIRGESASSIHSAISRWSRRSSRKASMPSSCFTSVSRSLS